MAITASLACRLQRPLGVVVLPGFCGIDSRYNLKRRGDWSFFGAFVCRRLVYVDSNNATIRCVTPETCQPTLGALLEHLPAPVAATVHHNDTSL